VKLLLDTHAFLWYALDDANLSAKAESLIDDPANDEFISPASYWELAIKISVGKYTLVQPYEDFLRQGIDGNGFIILPIHWRHTARLTNMPFHHRDPFDRLMIAQALVEQMPIVSNDALFDPYGVQRLW
jgi:PIN domain nuclease of toxin-antitoxin system